MKGRARREKGMMPHFPITKTRPVTGLCFFYIINELYRFQVVRALGCHWIHFKVKINIQNMLEIAPSATSGSCITVISNELCDNRCPTTRPRVAPHKAGLRACPQCQVGHRRPPAIPTPFLCPCGVSAWDSGFRLRSSAPNGQFLVKGAVTTCMDGA